MGRLSGACLVSDALSIAEALGELDEELHGWLLPLAGEWFKCKVTRLPRGLIVSEVSQPIEGGMSGSRDEENRWMLDRPPPARM